MPFEYITSGEFVLQWGGESYFNKQAVEGEIKEGKLIMQWDEDLFSVEDWSVEEAYFINHSCDSNTWMKDAFTLVAKRSIAKGEEITADYALWEAEEDYVSSWECHCGSHLCRHRVTGLDYKDPDIQARYKEHFSPLILKRIKKMN